MVLLYNVVNDLGRQLTEVAVYTLIQGGELKDETGLNSYLFTSTPLTAAVQTAIFQDQIYGFYNLDNFAKWNPINPGADPQKKRLFELELQTYFGLSPQQITELEKNWESLYLSNEQEFFATLVGNESFSAYQRVGYWQWADSFVTYPNASVV